MSTLYKRDTSQIQTNLQVNVGYYNMTTMKAILAVVVFSAIVYNIDAACNYQMDCKDSNSGEIYEPGEKWTERYDSYCMECYCSSNGPGASCCTTGYITNLPDHCVDIFDDTNCVHHVVEKSDPCQKCSGPVGAVGK